MPEPEVLKFTFKEVAELMVRQAGLTEGLWGLYVRFGIAAANTGTSLEDLKPTAIVPVLELGLQRFSEPSALTVDAAEIAGRSGSRGTRRASPARARARA